MHKRAKIISKIVHGNLTHSVQFEDGSLLGGVIKITIEIERQNIPKAIIEIIDFDFEMLSVEKSDA